LRWCDVDLELRTIRIEQTIQRVRARFTRDGKAGYRIAEPKTEKSRRVIEIAEMLVSVLRRQRARQAQSRLAAGTAWQNLDLDLVFTNILGGPLDPRALRCELRIVLERAGLPKMRIQDLRHSASTPLLAAGTPLHVVSRILGHSTITLTSNTYGHYTAEMRADAAKRMNRILGGSSC